MKEKRLIGVDPGIRKNTGISMYNPKSKEFDFIESMDVIDAYLRIKRLSQVYDIVVVIENPNLDSNVYGADTNLVDYVVSWAKRKVKDLKQLRSQIRKGLAWASNVGKNKGLAITIIEKLIEDEIPVVQIKPSERRRANEKIKIGNKLHPIKINQIPMPTKSTQAQFTQLTGCKLKTNEHGRDSATLLWNKSYTFFLNYARTQAINFANKKKQTKR